ncbi:MAG: tetratricopeptide repeat protein [Bacteroidetes bacterium]|nr:tetratricopeptide repeat protein [Bacteroidota bacterium]HET6243924.1 tetratricopeptide repeat protein [Bacteroidia bacterium]
MKIKLKLFSFFLLILIQNSFAFDSDSLCQKLKTLHDTIQIIELNKIGQDLAEHQPETAIKLTTQALVLAQKNHFISGQIKSLFLLGVLNRIVGKIDQSLNYHIKSLEIAETIGDKHYIANNYNNLGIIYKNQGNLKKAMEFYEKALEIQLLLDNKKGIASIYSNMGIIFNKENKLDKAIEMHKKSLEIEQLLEDYPAIAGTLNNIGTVYWHKSDLKSAIYYYKMALQLFEQYSDPFNKSMTLNNLGILYTDLGNYSVAIDYCQRSLITAREINDLTSVYYNYVTLSDIYSKTKDFEKAYKYHVLYGQSKDSLLDENVKKRFTELQQKYESDKKQQEITVLTKEKELQGLELNKKRIIIYAFIIGLVIVMVLAVVIFKENRQRHRANKELKKAYYNIEEKNKDITDSINYAKRIQEALLQEEEHISGDLPPHFILYKPKDILSGDFYWCLEKNGYLYLAASDCTGHGVPGAMMSMLGIAFLNEITSIEQLLSPAEILNKLRDKIVKELNQHGKEGESKDGMDISIIRLDLLTKELHWAGANNPLYLIAEKKENEKEGANINLSIPDFTSNIEYKDLKLSEIKPDKQPIGFHPNPSPFTNHCFQLEKDSSIYLLTDGFADQFGGPKGKKFKYAQLKKILLEHNFKSMVEQKEILNSVFDKWKGSLEQIDDVCIIGVKV